MSSSPDRKEQPGLPYSKTLESVLNLSREIANRMSHRSHIQSSDFVLALCLDEKVKKLLNGFRIEGAKPDRTTTESIRTGIEFFYFKVDEEPDQQETGLSINVKNSLDFATREANRGGAKEITPIYALLGIMIEGINVGGGVLESLGITLEKIRKRTKELDSA